MVRYCSCSRGIGFSNRTSVVTNGSGVQVCSHCGGVVPPERPYDYDPYTNPTGLYDYDTYNVLNKDYEHYCMQAKAFSIKGDHSAAIKFYKEIIRLSRPYTDCNFLSAIADEYESMGDYDSAEEYWNRCCAAEQHDSYKFIAGKGDFLYRRGRYEKAIGTYEDALRALRDMNDWDIALVHVKILARITHFIISSYNNLG